MSIKEKSFKFLSNLAFFADFAAIHTQGGYFGEGGGGGGAAP